MSELMNTLIYGIGWAVCLIGGVGIGSAITVWAMDRVLAATKTTNVVAQWWFAKKFPHRRN